MAAKRNKPKTAIDTPRKTPVFIGGALALALAAAASGALVVAHLGGLSLPGCGVGSACDAATASVWGRIPLIDWPMSHLGAAYFTAVLVAWLAAGGRTAVWLRAITRGGAAASLFYLGLMLVLAMPCRYCLATHVANLLFVAIVEWSPRATATSRRSMASLWIPFIAITTILAIFESSVRRQAADTAERNVAESTARIIAASSRPSSTSSTASAAADPPRPTAPFTGRYRLGPEVAPIRIVVFSDFQCRACKAVETELREIIAARRDVSLSAKHFPVSTDCNAYITRTMHPNACWAARAAEAAGILRGNDGFWAMHKALFDRGGGFTQAELRQMLTGMGYDTREFERVMTGPETLRLVRADIREAIDLGAKQTPMIFINGVEFRGWEAPRGITRAVEAIAATAPRPVAPDADRPVGALDKLVQDWREQPRSAVLGPEDRASIGPPDALVRIVVFGDYEVPGFATLDAVLRAELARRPDARYTPLHYPVNIDCNPEIPQSRNPQACWAARLAEAARLVHGPEAFWRLHEWLLANQACFSDVEFTTAAPALGLDADAVRAVAAGAEVAAIIRADAAAAKPLGLRVIPSLYVNDRLVPNWEHQGRPILDRLLDAAANEP